MKTVYNPIVEREKQTGTERGGGEILVETAGYIPKADQLQMMLDSGARLDNYYRNLYPSDGNYNPSEYDIDDDPTAQKGYDFFDAHADLVIAKSNMERKMLEAQKKTEADKASVAGSQISTNNRPSDTDKAVTSTGDQKSSENAKNYVP